MCVCVCVRRYASYEKPLTGSFNIMRVTPKVTLVSHKNSGLH